MKESYASERKEIETTLRDLDEKVDQKLISQEEYHSSRRRLLHFVDLLDKLEKTEGKSSEEERQELYNNSFVKGILNKILQQGGKIEPVHKVGTGFVYPIDGELSAEEVIRSDLIQKMVKLGILKKGLHKRQPLCHKCGSSSLVFQNACSNCRSHNIEVKNMIEHYRCGYVGPEVEFIKGTQLVCPKCNKELTLIGKDYRKIGTRVKCLDCGEISAIPYEYLSCASCGQPNDIGEDSNVDWQPLYSFTINEAFIPELLRLQMRLTPTRIVT